MKRVIFSDVYHFYKTMTTQESIDLSDVEQPYKKVNEYVEDNSLSKGRNPRYVKMSTLYWIVGLTVVVAAILLTINGIIVYYIVSGDKVCTFFVPEGHVLLPKDDLQNDQPNDDIQVSDQQKVLKATTMTTSHDVTTTATRKSSTDKPECPSGWMLTHGSSCYNISEDKQEWKPASNVCSGLGGYLVEINDNDENQFLVLKLLNDESHWIGLTDEINEGSWVWSNSNTPITICNYSNWYPGQPDNGRKNENCAEIKKDVPHSWNDDQCNTAHYYICERVLR